MNEWLMNLATANSIAVITAIGAGIWWFISRSFSHQAQIKNLETKIDHIDEKMDMVIASNTNLMKSHDDRISRLEKYFDVIMSAQIKKNSNQLKMES